MYTSIIEDGIIYKTTLGEQNKAIQIKLFAQDENMDSADGIVWNKADNKIYVADFLGNGVHSVDMNGKVQTLHKNGDTDGAKGLLDEPCEVIVRGNELIIVNMDMPFENPHLVFLGSPIWWFRPAPPLWTFVEKNDFSGKNVILFNTFNSRFKSEDIGEFGQKIEENGGRFVDHIYVRRGRVYHQMSGEHLIEESQEIVDKKMQEWI